MNEGVLVGGRYRLKCLLGTGAMGAVWAAVHEVTRKDVALKFLHGKHDDPHARTRLVREARAACSITHPNVVAVHDVLEDSGGTPILVMDLLVGESLAKRLAREGTLSPAETVRIVRPVVLGLAAAHAAGVIHRDLKPDNVFLDERSGAVKILDFGIAKMQGADGAKESHRLTQTGAMLGTPHYMAPEQAFGEADIDARADLFAVGAVLHECLVGIPPTGGQNLGQVLRVLATGKIRKLQARAPSLPSPLTSLVDDLLQVDRDKRPASAEAVAKRLEALTSLEEVPLPKQLWTLPSPSRRRAVVAALAVAATLLLTMTAAATLLVRRPVQSPPVESTVAAPPAQPAPFVPVATVAPTATPTATATPSVSSHRRAPPPIAPTARPTPSASPLLVNPTF